MLQVFFPPFPHNPVFCYSNKVKPRLLFYGKKKTIAFYVEQKEIRCKLNDFALKWDYIDDQTTLITTFPMGCAFSKYRKASAVSLNG